MANSYARGSTVTFSATFSVLSVLTDPTTVRLSICQPSGAITTYTYGVGDTVVKDSAGTYHANVLISAGTGTCYYQWEGTGLAPGVGVGEITITGSPF